MRHTIQSILAAFASIQFTYLIDANGFDETSPGMVVQLERRVNQADVRVFVYDEQYSPPTRLSAERPWRTVQCIEVVNHDGMKPRRVYQGVSPGRISNLSQTSIVLSGEHSHRCLYAISSEWQWVVARIVNLQSVVDPLPKDELGGTKLAPPPLIIPEPLSNPAHPEARALVGFGRRELGIDLEPGDRIGLETPIKTPTGWRIDASAYRTFDPATQKGEHKTIIRFAILLDEECTSATIEVNND